MQGRGGCVCAAERLTAAISPGVGMSSLNFAIAVAVMMFVGGSLGLALQRLLPETHITGGSREMIAAVVGLLTLLCALVTGLLIWTAYGVYASQNTQIQALASKVMQLDLALSDYGPETNPARAQLRDGLGKTIDQVWGASESNSNFAANGFAAAILNMRAREKALAALHPSTDAQKQALAAATVDVRFARSGANADVVRAHRSGVLSASADGRRLGRLPFLRLWAHGARNRPPR